MIPKEALKKATAAIDRHVNRGTYVAEAAAMAALAVAAPILRAQVLEDAAVERAAEAVPHDEQCGNSHLRNCGCKGMRIETARAVLAAAVREER